MIFLILSTQVKGKKHYNNFDVHDFLQNHQKISRFLRATRQVRKVRDLGTIVRKKRYLDGLHFIILQDHFIYVSCQTTRHT